MCWFSYLFFVWNSIMIRHRTENLQTCLVTQRQNPGWIIFIKEGIPSSKSKRGSIDIGDVHFESLALEMDVYIVAHHLCKM